MSRTIERTPASIDTDFHPKQSQRDDPLTVIRDAKSISWADNIAEVPIPIGAAGIDSDGGSSASKRFRLPQLPKRTRTRQSDHDSGYESSASSLGHHNLSSHELPQHHSHSHSQEILGVAHGASAGPDLSSEVVQSPRILRSSPESGRRFSNELDISDDRPSSQLLGHYEEEPEPSALEIKTWDDDILVSDRAGTSLACLSEEPEGSTTIVPLHDGTSPEESSSRSDCIGSRHPRVDGSASRTDSSRCEGPFTPSDSKCGKRRPGNIFHSRREAHFAAWYDRKGDPQTYNPFKKSRWNQRSPEILTSIAEDQCSTSDRSSNNFSIANIHKQGNPKEQNEVFPRSPISKRGLPWRLLREFKRLVVDYIPTCVELEDTSVSSVSGESSYKPPKAGSVLGKVKAVKLPNCFDQHGQSLRRWSPSNLTTGDKVSEEDSDPHDIENDNRQVSEKQNGYADAGTSGSSHSGKRQADTGARGEGAGKKPCIGLVQSDQQRDIENERKEKTNYFVCPFWAHNPLQAGLACERHVAPDVYRVRSELICRKHKNQDIDFRQDLSTDRSGKQAWIKMYERLFTGERPPSSPYVKDRLQIFKEWVEERDRERDHQQNQVPAAQVMEQITALADNLHQMEQDIEARFTALEARLGVRMPSGSATSATASDFIGTGQVSESYARYSYSSQQHPHRYPFQALSQPQPQDQPQNLLFANPPPFPQPSHYAHHVRHGQNVLPTNYSARNNNNNSNNLSPLGGYAGSSETLSNASPYADFAADDPSLSLCDVFEDPLSYAI